MTILVVQDDTGTVADANAYITLDEFKAYHNLRGNDVSGYTDPQIEQAIVRATDYIDTRFIFRGITLTKEQATMWPRQAGVDIFLPWDTGSVDFAISGTTTFVALVDPNGASIDGIPSAIKKVSSEYGFRALSAALFQDAPAPEGGRLIDKESVTVDVITRTVEYAASQGTGTFQMPAYPAADLMLARAGLIIVGRQLFR